MIDQKSPLLSKGGIRFLLCFSLFFGIVKAEDEGPWGRQVSKLLGDHIPSLMQRHKVPGVSVAVFEGITIVLEQAFGSANAEAGIPLTKETRLEACSMSKPLFAYAFLKVVEAGKMQLDEPISTYLQRAVERTVQSPLFPWIASEALEPLGMSHSSYTWREGWKGEVSGGHNRDGEVIESRPRYRNGNAAFTLFTTAGDYCRFLIEMANPAGQIEGRLGQPYKELMLTRAYPESEEGDRIFALGWMLYRGSEENGFYHTGSNGSGFRCVSWFQRNPARGLVILTNATGGKALHTELMELQSGKPSP